MTHQSILPERIMVRVTRSPIGVWVADSPDLLGFSVMSNSESHRFGHRSASRLPGPAALTALKWSPA